MRYLGVNELREEFLTFFEKKGHKRFTSFSLIPQDDNSLLLINSGMAPLKKYFLGQKKCEGNKATDCQKCIRTPDIDRVGITSRHGTFFEMLGNFSFGDYFKTEAIAWAWEFATKVIEIPISKIYVTVYESDDETYNIWLKDIGVGSDHIKRLGKEDNFWEIGTGPCGPCSELYYDRGEKYGCGKPDCGPGCDCDRYVEFWNLVFSQYISDGKGNYEEMEHKNIDTGMGLERLACIVQGVDNLFEIDTVQKILQEVCRLTHKKYNENKQDDISIRVITDHIRSSVFLISDKVVPANEGRGYVLRRLLRRAMRHGRKLGVSDLFLYKLCDVVVNENKSAYPELEENVQQIKNIIKNEEEKFLVTINQGLSLLGDMLKELEQKHEKVLPGELIFKLYDTFGFPVEIIEEVAAESNITLDKDKFEDLMRNQKQMARNARKKLGDLGWDEEAENILENCPTSEFVGYNNLEAQTEITWLSKNGLQCNEVKQGELCQLVLAKTPFYATSGGQVNDIGVVLAEGSELEILNNQKHDGGRIIATAKVVCGSFKVGQKVLAKVDVQKRKATCKNHSACHILQKALQEVLGEHVKQAGSYVDAARLRFDFSHFKALSSDELLAVEAKVNEIIFAELPVNIAEMNIEEAKKTGAMALFDERYGENVRVCCIGDYSKEFCGGTHVSNTAQINMFKIVSEGSVSAGVRRIEAITGENVFKRTLEVDETINKLKEDLKIKSNAELEPKVLSLMEEIKTFEVESSNLKLKILNSVAENLLKDARLIKDINLVCAVLKDIKPDELRIICDILRAKQENILAILVGQSTSNSIAVAAGKVAVETGLVAGNIVKELCQKLGGSGGGKKEMAMGSILNVIGLSDIAQEIVQKNLR